MSAASPFGARVQASSNSSRGGSPYAPLPTSTSPDHGSLAAYYEYKRFVDGFPTAAEQQAGGIQRVVQELFEVYQQEFTPLLATMIIKEVSKNSNEQKDSFLNEIFNSNGENLKSTKSLFLAFKIFQNQIRDEFLDGPYSMMLGLNNFNRTGENVPCPTSRSTLLKQKKSPEEKKPCELDIKNLIENMYSDIDCLCLQEEKQQKIKEKIARIHSDFQPLFNYYESKMSHQSTSS